MLYTLYFYDGIPTREGRAAKYSGEGISIEELNFDSDESALIYAAETVYEMNNNYDESRYDSADSALAYLESLDFGDGSAFCVAVKCGNNFVYGTQDYIDALYYFEPDVIFDEGEEVLADDVVTEAIVNNSKINDFANIKLEINELKKDIDRIKYDTAQVGDYCFNSKILDFLSAEDKDNYLNLESQMSEIEADIKNLESQYKTVEYKYFRTGPWGDDMDVDEVVTILDDKLKDELEPKVEELEAELSSIRKQAYDLRKKAIANYNSDAASRRAQSNLDDKNNQLKELENHKSSILKEISEDEEFSEVSEWLASEWDTVEIINVGISDIGLFADFNVTTEFELDDEDFDDDMIFAERRLEGELESKIEDLDLDTPFECENSNAKIKLDLIDSYVSGDPTISRTFIPGRNYMPNGDPGYPDEYDFEIMGEAIGSAIIRATKIR